ncbi:MAG: porin family protein [Deferribacteraceae bacterium]|jgi:hypothetical protein|nr:porin family protein [Deferribacteraceae bacterium]
MKRVFFTVLVFASFMLILSEARAFELGAGAGAYIPSSDVDKLGFPAGYSVNAHIDQDIFPLLSLRLSADYSAADFKKSGFTHEFSTYGGALLLVFTPPIPVLDLYAGVGYNGHWFEYETSAPGVSAKGSDFGHGVIGQAGVGIGILIFHIGVNGQYYIAEGDFDAGGWTVGLGFGVSI